MPLEKIYGPSTVKVTPMLVDEFVKMEKAPGERPLSTKRLAMLQESINNGLFRSAEWVSVDINGVVYRMNGQHTSYLFASLAPQQLEELSVTLVRYKADSHQDVSELYATFDSSVSARSIRDVDRYNQKTHPLLAELPVWIVNSAITGIFYSSLFESKTQGVRRATASERAALMHKHTDFVIWFKDLMVTNNYKIIDRAGVIAAIFMTYTKDATGAKQFWEAVRDGTGNSPTTGDRKLNWLLLKTRCNIDSKDNAGPRALCHKSIQAWNAWRLGKTATNLNYQPGKPLPEIV